MNFFVPFSSVETGGQESLHSDHLEVNIVEGLAVLGALAGDLQSLRMDTTTLMWRLHANSLERLVRKAIELYPGSNLSTHVQMCWAQITRKLESSPGPTHWGDSTELPDWWWWSAPDIHAGYRQQLLLSKFEFYQPRWVGIKLKRPEDHPVGIIPNPPAIARLALKGRENARLVRCGEYLFAGSANEIVDAIFSRTFSLSWSAWLKRIGYPAGRSLEKVSILTWMLETGIAIDNTYLRW